MKQFALLAVLLLVLPASVPLADDEERPFAPLGLADDAGPAPWMTAKPGDMPGWGHHRRGGMEGWVPMGQVLSRLPDDKRATVRALHFSTQREMIGKRAELERARLDLREAMQAYPLDAKAAQAAFDKVSAARSAMFSLRMTRMAQMQEILGPELWQEMRDGFGPGMGPGYGRGMGPGGGGGMGPGYGPGPRR